MLYLHKSLIAANSPVLTKLLVAIRDSWRYRISSCVAWVSCPQKLWKILPVILPRRFILSFHNGVKIFLKSLKTCVGVKFHFIFSMDRCHHSQNFHDSSQIHQNPFHSRILLQQILLQQIPRLDCWHLLPCSECPFQWLMQETATSGCRITKISSLGKVFLSCLFVIFLFFSSISSNAFSFKTIEFTELSS